MRREEATFLDSSIFIGAYFGGELFGFVELVWDETRNTGGVDEYHFDDPARGQGYNKCPVAQAVRACA